MNGLFFEPVVKVKPVKFLSLSAGFNVTYLVKSKFHQEEAITKPSSGVTFIDSSGNDTYSRVRNVFDGDIPNVNRFQFFVVSRIGVEFPLSKQWEFKLAPEISVYLPLVNFAKDISWKISKFSLGASLKFSPPPPKKKNRFEEKIYQIDTIILKTNLEPPLRFKKGKETISETVTENDETIVKTIRINRRDTIFTYHEKKLQARLELFAIDSLGN
ncbi:MAG: hypothetical protein N2560_10525, partial [Ignavibacteria bacterium]|nr:hypothetical protein [Ignavibacteria bacterium]